MAIGILGLAGELVAWARVLGEGAHEPALVVGVLQAVEEHVVENAAVTQPIAGARPTRR